MGHKEVCSRSLRQGLFSPEGVDGKELSELLPCGFGYLLNGLSLTYVGFEYSCKR